MGDKWKEMTLGDFAPFLYGKGLPEKSRHQSGHIPVFGSNGVIGMHNEVLVNNAGVIIGRKGTVGAVHFSKSPFWPIDTTFYIESKPEREIRYVYYLLRSLGLEHMNADSAVPGLNRNAAHSRTIFIPPLPEQKAIASILGAMDDKIELNRKMNETLEAMARALFKSWFVDFDPIPGLGHHKEWQDSPLGKIPKGWRVKNLDEIANYLNGLALQKFPPEDDEFLPVIKIAQLRKDSTEGSDKASAKIDPAYVVKDGDVLFSWSGSLEVVIWCGGCGALNQHLFKVTSNLYPRWFYYLWTKQYLPDFQTIAAGKATTMGHIQRHHLAAAKVLVPPPNLLKAMDTIMSPLIENKIVNSVQSRTLTSIRDALLPKLLSGEIRVKDAEMFVETV
ncbi:MAG: restriction endonuclease subunit S [Deltaproteobacteria bacterium]|nr:restriction endonuclease subunit S [Deltaproteobacteria bacterium]